MKLKRMYQYKDFDQFMRAFAAEWNPITGSIPFKDYCNKNSHKECLHSDTKLIDLSVDRQRLAERAHALIIEIRQMWDPYNNFNKDIIKLKLNIRPLIEEADDMARYIMKSIVNNRIEHENWDCKFMNFCKRKGYDIYPEAIAFRRISMEVMELALQILFWIDKPSYLFDIWNDADRAIKEARSVYVQYLSHNSNIGIVRRKQQSEFQRKAYAEKQPILDKMHNKWLMAAKEFRKMRPDESINRIAAYVVKHCENGNLTRHQSVYKYLLSESKKK